MISMSGEANDVTGAPPQTEFRAITQIVGIDEYNELKQRYGAV
jgi:hypothetical protein